MGGPAPVDLASVRAQTRLVRDYPESFVAGATACLWLERCGDEKRLAIMAPAGDPLLKRFVGEPQGSLFDRVLILCLRSVSNALALRDALPRLQPVPLGLVTSAGFGDRLGRATPGHVRALQHVTHGTSDRKVAPIFAQQSIREMSRTGRTPVDVLTDATWGTFEAGWHGPVGADADHLKTSDDVDATVAAGYSLYTIDPSAYVDDEADQVAPSVLHRKLDALPWRALESDYATLQRTYGGRRVALDDRMIALDDESLARAAVKYGRAIVHVSDLYRHLVHTGVTFELEISVDETENPTSHQEHIYIAYELRRLGVRWVSLAPRYVGRFEKGVDFIGNLDSLQADLEGHAAIARALGPYKLSLHSGSDKFSVYPLIVEATRGLVHLKTAGTSYLEALRVTARADPALFRAILSCAQDHYAQERETYYVSADPRRVILLPLPDDRLPDLLNETDARQVLHVTFGVVLAEFRSPLLELLRTHEEAYSQALVAHFSRHLLPFVQPPDMPAERTLE